MKTTFLWAGDDLFYMFLTVAILTTVLFILVFFCKYILQSGTEYEVLFDDMVSYICLTFMSQGPLGEGGVREETCLFTEAVNNFPVICCLEGEDLQSQIWSVKVTTSVQ
jgi:hypothetical protein